MSWSSNFFLHIIVFGTTSAVLMASYILHLRVVSETSWEKKLYVGGLMMTFAKFAHYNVALLLVTGIINMVNRYGMNAPWPFEHWLVTKIVLFFIVAFNGLFLGKRMGMKRGMLIKSVVEGNGPADAEEQLKKQNSSISMLFIVQIILLLAITFLAVYGTGKHPGVI